MFAASGRGIQPASSFTVPVYWNGGCLFPSVSGRCPLPATCQALPPLPAGSLVLRVDSMLGQGPPHRPRAFIFQRIHCLKVDFFFLLQYPHSYGLSRWLSGKESACSAGDLGLIPGLGRSPGEGHGCLLWYSCLENSMDR